MEGANVVRGNLLDSIVLKAKSGSRRKKELAGRRDGKSLFVSMRKKSPNTRHWVIRRRVLNLFTLPHTFLIK
jgi:hypothetical protein